MDKKQKSICNYKDATVAMRPIQDALDVLHGRWRIPILVSIMMDNQRFTQIKRSVNGISDKVLAKELKDLELNELITRTIYETFPPTVEYSITEHGKTLENVMLELRMWGIQHRKKVI